MIGREIRPIGGYFPKDEEGFVVNPTSWSHIPSQWEPILESIKMAYLKAWGDRLHSIWIRGSLPRGLYQDGVSDVDLFALVHEDEVERWATVSWTSKVERRFKKSYSFVGDLELMVSSYVTNLAIARPKIAMLIQTQSLCLWGEDIRAAIPRYKPGRAMMLHYRWLKTDLEGFQRNEQITTKDVRAITKVMIRSGFELVMERAKEYTPDLYFCCETFGQYYPQHFAKMRETLHYFLDPGSAPSKIKSFVLSFGKWLEKEIDKNLL